MDAKYLAKTEVDRIADTVRGEVRDGLMQIADKLYKRNPREWKKAGVDSREAALARLEEPQAAQPARTRRAARGPGGGAGLQRDLTKAIAWRR